MEDFKINLKKEELITNQDILDCGWILKDENGLKKGVFCYEKDNYILIINYNFIVPILNIIIKDPSLEHWWIDPEKFKITIKCPSKKAFQAITSLI